MDQSKVSIFLDKYFYNDINDIIMSYMFYPKTYKDILLSDENNSIALILHSCDYISFAEYDIMYEKIYNIEQSKDVIPRWILLITIELGGLGNFANKPDIQLGLYPHHNEKSAQRFNIGQFYFEKKYYALFSKIVELYRDPKWWQVCLKNEKLLTIRKNENQIYVNLINDNKIEQLCHGDDFTEAMEELNKIILKKCSNLNTNDRHP